MHVHTQMYIYIFIYVQHILYIYISLPYAYDANICIYTWVLLLPDLLNVQKGRMNSKAHGASYAPCLMCHLQLSVRTLAWKIYKFKCNWDLRTWGNKHFFVVGNWREGRETDGTKLGNIEYCEPIWRWWVDMPISFHIRMWNGVYNSACLGNLYEASCIVHQGHLRSSGFRWLETHVYLRSVYSPPAASFLRCFCAFAQTTANDSIIFCCCQFSLDVHGCNS